VSFVVRIARDDAERVASIAVVVEGFEVKGPLWLHEAKRLASLARSRAAWWVAVEDGKVVGATLSYPLRLTDPSGGVHAGYGIGALVTRASHRRRGIAGALLAATAEGAGIGLLYSGIPPATYERHGFRVVPAFDHLCADPAALAASGRRASLRPIDPRVEHRRLGAAWDQGHPGLRLHRDAAAWSASLAENPTDFFFAAEDGYVRLRQGERELEVVELLGASPAPVLRALGSFAVDLQVPLRGWFDPVPEVASHFTDRGRARTLPMVHRWSHPETARFWSSDYF
jgi:GNAT superfamily N-acetyltransferase